MIPFLKLIRVKNLVVILLTMIGVAYHLQKMHPYEVIDFNAIQYSLLIFSTLIIAAAGHLINDYFDLKADRINKPQELILTKYLQKRWAILGHWTLNFIAFAIAIYLSWSLHTLLFVFIHLVSINLLWFYSVSWKRKLLLGSVVLAILPALVIFLSTWYFQILNESDQAFSPFKEQTWSTYLNYHYAQFLAFCAFFVTLSREILKDVNDMPGDELLNANTIPRKIGAKKATWLALITLQFPAFLFIVLKFAGAFSIPSNLASVTLGFLAILFLSQLIWFAIQPEKANKWLLFHYKIAIPLGLLTLFF
ncbi:MAG: UbiA family prenyltransferase [Flavobacteriales bacterium]